MLASSHVKKTFSTGEYSGLEHETVPGVVESLKIVTRKNIERIARFAFNYASTHDRKKAGSKREGETPYESASLAGDSGAQGEHNENRRRLLSEGVQ